MTEKELYILQNDIFWLLENKLNGVPPLLQKIIVEGIYSRFQTKAAEYEWSLNIQDSIDKEKGETGNEQNQETES